MPLARSIREEACLGQLLKCGSAMFDMPLEDDLTRWGRDNILVCGLQLRFVTWISALN